jgi:hypothetical protein
LAVVKQDNVNVRGQPVFTSEVITRLQHGDVVTVLEQVRAQKSKPGEPELWARIAMPTNTTLWVYNLFVDAVTKTVIAKRLNLRSGPSENHSVVGRLDQGTVVDDVSTKGEWLEIRVPTNAYAFVAADLLEKQPPAPTAAAVATSAPAPDSATATTEPVSLVASSNTPPEIAISLAAVSPPATPDVEPAKTPTDAAPAASEPSVAPAAAVEPAPSSTQAYEVFRSTSVTRPILLTPPAAPATASAPTTAPSAAPGAQAPETHLSASPPPGAEPTLGSKPRMVRREGVVGRSLSIQAPAHFELSSVETGRAINYLISPSVNIPLKRLRGRRVFVTGQEFVDQRWPKTPVLEIEQMELLP